MDHEGVFLAFLAVSCRISRASGGFAPWTPIRALPWNRWEAQSAPNPQPPTAGNNDRWSLLSYLWHNIHTSCDLQTTDSEKNNRFCWKNSGKSGWKSSKTRGGGGEDSEKMMLKILYEPCISSSESGQILLMIIMIIQNKINSESYLKLKYSLRFQLTFVSYLQ